VSRLATILLCPLAVFAQSSIQGLVTDPSGAASYGLDTYCGL